MTQHKYKIYIISNDVDDMIYIGSTKQKLGRRWQGYKSDIKNNCQKKITQHMINLGIEHFCMEMIKEIICTKKVARIQEYIETTKYDKNNLLNSIRPYSHNHDKTRNNEKKKKNRRDYYNRHRDEPEFKEKYRKRNREYNRRRRAEEKKTPRELRIK